MLAQNSITKQTHLTIKHIKVKRDNFMLDIKDLNIDKGHYIALVGGNGAGKSTLLEALLDLIDSDVLDFRLDELPTGMLDKQTLGTQLQTLSWNPEFTVSDIITLHRALYGQQDRRIYDLLGLEALAKKSVMKTSRGERVRIDLFMAFAHHPKLIILDEPSTGLDAGYIQVLCSLVSDAIDRGASILSATHDPREMAICDEIWWLEKGRLESSASLSSLIENYLGPWRANLSIPSPSHFNEIQDIFVKAGFKINSSETNELIVYGQENVQDILKEISRKFYLSGWGVSKTSSADLLHHIANNAISPEPAIL